MKKYYVTVNGNRYEVEVEEVNGDFEKVEAPVRREEQQVQTQVAKVPAAKETVAEEQPQAPKQQPKAVPSEGERLECPMPGTILSVNVKEGDNIKKGQVMFVLEAMKMENEIMAARDGKILSVNVDKGAAVNTGDLLAVIG